MVEHATQPEYDSLCDFAVAFGIYDWPVATMSQMIQDCDACLDILIWINRVKIVDTRWLLTPTHDACRNMCTEYV
jgi:hypothetical protein